MVELIRTSMAVVKVLEIVASHLKNFQSNPFSFSFFIYYVLVLLLSLISLFPLIRSNFLFFVYGHLQSAREQLNFLPISRNINNFSYFPNKQKQT